MGRPVDFHPREGDTGDCPFCDGRWMRGMAAPGGGDLRLCLAHSEPGCDTFRHLSAEVYMAEVAKRRSRN